MNQAMQPRSRHATSLHALARESVADWIVALRHIGSDEGLAKAAHALLCHSDFRHAPLHVRSGDDVAWPPWPPGPPLRC